MSRRKIVDDLPTSFKRFDHDHIDDHQAADDVDQSTAVQFSRLKGLEQLEVLNDSNQLIESAYTS